MRWLVLLAALSTAASAAPRYKRTQPFVEPDERASPLAPRANPAKPTFTSTDVSALLGIVNGALPSADSIAKLEASIRQGESQAGALFEYATSLSRLARHHRASTDTKDQQVGKSYLIRAVKAFKALVDNDHRDFSGMDTALFHYGYMLQSFKYMAEARQVYAKLLKNYPTSSFVPSAHVAFADYYYDNGQLADAEAHYKRVLKFPKAPAFWYATYKLGWVHVELQRFSEALEAFFEVAQGTKANPTALTRAARLDFNVPYAAIGSPTKALAVFERVHAPSRFEMAAVLAERYIATNQIDKAYVLYRDMIARAPSHANVCAWQHMAARASMSIQNVDIRREVAALAQLAAKSTQPECIASAKAMASLDARWFLAELSWSSERWVDSAEAFLAIARDRSTPQDRARDAAFAATLAYRNLLDIDPALEWQAGFIDVTSKRRKLPPATKPSAHEAAMLDAFATYAMVAGNSRDAELGNMRFLEATLHRRRGDHAAAVPPLVDYVHWNKDAYGVVLATRLLLDSLLAQHKDSEALSVIERLDPSVTAKPALANDIEFVRSRSQRR